ncbi:MAG: 2-hydroxyacid dehydrogenase, partial [Bradyrhizobiaceae bacterium]|nr:2-hydroxyacid dehydrogenase [Bradyrhizobiaceae bacterium]
MKPDVLAIGWFPDATRAELGNRFNLHHFRRIALAHKGLPPDIAARVRGLATEANNGADRALIEKLPKLEIIAVFGVGIDAVDLAAARERHVPVTNTPGILADEVGDLAIGLMLASARQIVAADRFVREGQWERGPISLGRSIRGKTLGIVGLGEIGRAIAARAAAFRMKIIYTGPRAKPDLPYTYVADLVDLARQSDFLMVTCKGGSQTYHLISAAVLDAL